MKIVSLNIRATQGGAGRVGYDLHKRLQALGHNSSLLYGYGSGIKSDPNVGKEPEVRMLGSRLIIGANYASHFLLGEELFTPGLKLLRSAFSEADIVHVHAPHHWYLRWSTVIRALVDAQKPVVVTAHDWWLVSGRCGFVRDCLGWRRECGECGEQRFDDLPSLFDRSRQVRSKRQHLLRELASNVVIACPSQHLQRDHQSIYPDLDVRFVPNAIDREYEAAVDVASPDVHREKIVFCASDLSSPGKIDAKMVHDVIQEKGEVVGLIGRNNPFLDTRATVFGEVRSRRQLASIFGASRALIFTSQMDNAPLTIIEALFSGCHVVAYPSPAASEMLALVGGRCAESPAEARAIISEGREAELYGGATNNEIAARARQIWAGERFAASYISLYREMIERHSDQPT